MAWIAGLGCAPLAWAGSAVHLQEELLPAPRELSLRGEPQPVGSGPLVLAGTLGGSGVPWDPIAGLAAALRDRRIDWRPLAVDAGERGWSVALLSATTRPERGPVGDGQNRIGSGLGPEAYRLETFPGAPGVYATIVAGGPRGLLYGLQTLAELLARAPGMLPWVLIRDWPDIAGIRELHVHGFDKGYGAGDFKSLTAFTRDLPAILPRVAAARFNLIRFSLDAGWVNTVDRWLPGTEVDAVMRDAVHRCRRAGVEALIEVRFEGQRAGSTEPDPYPLNPLTEWDYYETALRRVLAWEPDAVDLSLNDLRAISYPDVVAKYGKDGRYSGRLMAEMLHRAKAVIDETGRATRLHHLPRFYGDVHWARHPDAMPELWSAAPPGTVMYITSDVAEPTVVAMRREHGAQFVHWVNFTSNHAKELKVMLTGATPLLAAEITGLPPSERHVLINLGYPIAPQHAVVLATGELLWNNGAYDTFGSLSKAARRVWGDAGDLFVRYARLLDAATIMASRGVAVADAVRGKVQVAEDERALGEMPAAAARGPADWQSLRARAAEARQVAQTLQAAVADPELKRVAEVLAWNARRVELDAQAGELACAGFAAGRMDAAAIERILQEHEQIIREHTPVEPNDPKSAEVVMRGIRSIRQALSHAKR